MNKEIYEAVKERISIAPEEAVKIYYEDYPETPKDATVYRFDLTGDRRRHPRHRPCHDHQEYVERRAALLRVRKIFRRSRGKIDR